MSIYNPLPTFPISGQAIDGNNNNIFTWDFQSDSGEIQTSYQLLIYSLANATIYDSTVASTPNHFHTVPLSTLTNGTTYKWKVIVNGIYTSTVQVFNATTTPTISVDTLPNPFIHQFYNFTATYAQAQSIPVKSFKWYLYDSTGLNLIQQSDEIIGQTIQYQFDYLADSTQYWVKVRVRNQAETTVSSTPLTFVPNYTKPYDPTLFQVSADNSTGLNKLDWSSVVTQIGSVTGTYQFVSGVWGYALHLDSGSYLNYNLSAPIPATFTSEIFLKLPSTFNGVLFNFYKNGEVAYEIGYMANTQRFYYKRGNRFTSGNAIALPNGYFLFIVKPNQIQYKIGGTTYTVR